MAQSATTGSKPKAMTKAEFEEVVIQMRDDARNFMDTEINPEQEKLWRYYNGKVDKSPPRGRSQFVVTELRDAVESAMVSLFRIFLTSDKPVIFKPGSDDDVKRIPQQIATVNHIFFEENNGFRLMSDAFRDALVAKFGCFKTYWDESTEVETIHYSEVSELDFSALQADDSVEIDELDVQEDDQGLIYELRVKKTHEKGRIRVEAIPSEEIIIDRRAETADSALFIGQDGFRRRQDVVNDGLATWKQTQLSQVAATGSTTGTTNVSNVRDARANFAATEGNQAGAATEDTTGAIDEAAQLIRVGEFYVRLDKNRDGVTNLWRCIVIGDTVIDFEEWDINPLALGSAFFRPHTAIGFGLGDLLWDVQEASSAMVRSMFDSLVSAVNPHPVIVQNQANLADVLRPEHHAVWREKQPNMIRYMSAPFVGKEVMPVMEWFEGRKEMRTGISKASQGLDPDALQSSVEFGVISTLSAAQAKTETMARSICETLMVPTFQKVSRLLAAHQNEDMFIRLNGEFVPIPPDVWNSDMDAVANVGIGRGGQLELTQQLTAVLDKQEQLFQQLGAENPIVEPVQYAQTIHDLLGVNGMKDTKRHFNMPEVVQQKSDEKNAEEPPPDPLVQIEMQKIEAEKAKNDGKLKLDAEKQANEQQMAAQAQKFEQELALWEANEKIRLSYTELGLETQLEKFKIINPPVTPSEGQLRAPNGSG